MFGKIKNFIKLCYMATTTPAVHYCNCVCHSPVSSRAWCEHCEGDNSVSSFKKAEEKEK